MRTFSFLIGVLVLGFTAGCQDEVVSVDSDAALSATEVQSTQALAKVGRGLIWADGELFETIGTPALFDGEHGKFDILFQGNFKNGIGAISESKPGDQDWNGGRWEVWVLKDGVMTDYTDADGDSDLNISDFEPAGVYLECPLLPRRGRN